MGWIADQLDKGFVGLCLCVESVAGAPRLLASPGCERCGGSGLVGVPRREPPVDGRRDAGAAADSPRGRRGC